MEKIKYKHTIILCILCLLLGIFIGTHNAEKQQEQTQVKVADTTKYYNSQVEFYDDIIKDINIVEVYDSTELTTDILTNRDGKIIIEKVIGEVTTQDLDGKILNCNANNNGYISYKNTDGVKKGNIVLTYYVYNPLSNVEDDVLTRIDYIIDGKSM